MTVAFARENSFLGWENLPTGVLYIPDSGYVVRHHLVDLHYGKATASELHAECLCCLT